MVTVIKKGTPKEEIRRRINEIVSQKPKEDIRKYAGSLSTEINPMDYQNTIRDEWK
jgi:hypothetical protein